MLLECLGSTIAESHGFGLILQLYTFVFSFSALPLWFASLSPTQHSFASFSPKGSFVIWGHPGLRAVTWRGHGQDRGIPLVLSAPPLQALAPGPLPALQGPSCSRKGHGEKGAGPCFCEPMGVFSACREFQTPMGSQAHPCSLFPIQEREWGPSHPVGPSSWVVASWKGRSCRVLSLSEGPCTPCISFH